MPVPPSHRRCGSLRRSCACSAAAWRCAARHAASRSTHLSSTPRFTAAARQCGSRWRAAW
eukprot:scaffold94385_cov59-Phaeocystis_antarctica.AAC.3